jgi:Tol biopolymer transport system component
MRDPAWSPDGKHLALVVIDRIWTMQPDGRDGSELTKAPGVGARAGVVSLTASASPSLRIAVKDSISIVVSAHGGTPERVAVLEGDERWPSWTPDGRIVFANRASDTTQWDLFVIDPDVGNGQADSAAAHAITGRRSAAARLTGWTTPGLSHRIVATTKVTSTSG